MRMSIRNEIFSRDTIERALADYHNLLSAKVEVHADYSEVEISACKYDEAITIHELENYMIGIENS